MPWIHERQKQANAGVADKDYFTDSEGNVTDDPEKGAFHLIREGQEIPKNMADKYGIGKVASEEEQESKKSVKGSKPSKNKSVKPAKNKGAK